MPFWLAFGITEEFEDGSGSSVTVIEPGFASFDEAANSLVEADVPVAGGRVTEANAYVAEADTMREVSVLVQAVFTKQESSPNVLLVQRNIRTRGISKEPPEIEALQRLHGELCITHQLTEFALTLAPSDKPRKLLNQHKLALEELGVAVQVMRDGVAPPSTEGSSGSERMGYGAGHLGGTESATFAGALGSLVGELSIASHQADLTRQIATAAHERGLRDLTMELQRFSAAVSEMQLPRG